MNNYFERLYDITKRCEEVEGCPVYIAGTWVNTGAGLYGEKMLDVENADGGAWLFDNADVIAFFGSDLIENALVTLENGAN